MVIPGSRVQGTGIRIISFFFIGMSFPTFVVAKDFGTHGTIFSVEEKDPIALIQQKLKVMEDSGELKQRNLELQKRARASVERPKPVEGITKATKDHIFTYDPTYEVKEDLYDHQGRIFAKKGSKFNPLETVKLSANLVFFDGDDLEQMNWVKKELNAQTKEKPSIKLILVKGEPLKLSKEFGIPVYFDQEGRLSSKLKIKHVPARISQIGPRLKIEEIDLNNEEKIHHNKGLIK